MKKVLMVIAFSLLLAGCGKSPFNEVDVSVIYNGQSAVCNLTSSTADVIDKQGMWDDGDFLGAWKLYDKAYLPPSLS